MMAVPVSVGRGLGDKSRNNSTLYAGDKPIEWNTEELTNTNRWMQHTANLNYTHVFSSALDRELTVNLDYNRNNSLTQTRSSSDYIPATLPAYTLNLAQDTRHLTDIYSARVDFQTNFWRHDRRGATTTTTRSIQVNYLSGSLVKLHQLKT